MKSHRTLNEAAGDGVEQAQLSKAFAQDRRRVEVVAERARQSSPLPPPFDAS